MPFVPSDDAVIAAMLDLAQVGRNDILYDLGCGDGRIPVAAALGRNTRCVGIDLDPLRIADAMELAGHSRVEHLVDFIEEDLFTADFSEATVVTLYLLDAVNVQLRPRLLDELRPGTRIVSHAFDMGDWKADQELRLGGTTLYRWIVPARVEGVWEWEGLDGQLYRVELQQAYQAVSGTAWVGDDDATLEDVALCGAELSLKVRHERTGACRAFTLEFSDGELDSIWEDEGDADAPATEDAR